MMNKKNSMSLCFQTISLIVEALKDNVNIICMCVKIYYFKLIYLDTAWLIMWRSLNDYLIRVSRYHCQTQFSNSKRCLDWKLFGTVKLISNFHVMRSNFRCSVTKIIGPRHHLYTNIRNIRLLMFKCYQYIAFC